MDVREIMQKIEHQYSYDKSLGITVREPEKGKIVLELPITHSHLNYNHAVHGAVYAGLLDTATGLTIRSLTGQSSVTIQLNVHYLAPGKEGDLQIPTASIWHQGYKMVTGEAEVRNQEGRLLAKSVGIFKLKRADTGSNGKGERA